MKREVYQELPGIGRILYKKSSRSRYVRITVKPFEGVRVTVPRGVSLARAEAFVVSKRTWIESQLKRMAPIEEEKRAIQKRLNALDYDQAARRLKERLQELSLKHGYSYNRVSVRHQKTRLGSCSAQNNISLNIELALLPPDLRDYVLIHELVHTRHKNHGKAFYRELESIVGEVKPIRKRLRHERIGRI